MPSFFGIVFICTLFIGKLQAKILSALHVKQNDFDGILLIFAFNFFQCSLSRVLNYIEDSAVYTQFSFQTKLDQTCEDVEQERQQFVWLSFFPDPMLKNAL